ncbi:MAG: helicase [Deltaproteobacteria bacterium]|nr:helicase [Deltaproteobacteria bacterium]
MGRAQPIPRRKASAGYHSNVSHIVAMLGPTNTGKTHRAIERMLDFPTGMIGLPLRLLAREVYDRVALRVGLDKVALVTGEEKRVPAGAAYWICTVEAMPVSKTVAFLAVDEIQLAAHPQRGHVFTERLLHARGEAETWFLGSDTMRTLVGELVPAAELRAHPRLSDLGFAGVASLSQLKPRSAVVAFTVNDVYALAERLRVGKGGAAVVLGALSPRTRNAQVAMFQAGEVDYMVATDAIGMGLNLDLQHVCFAALDKFDGKEVRQLELAELGQIAGRAGRYLHAGTFGTLSPIELPAWAARSIELQRFDSVRRVSWRAHELDFASIDALLASLQTPSRRGVLIPVSDAEDTAALAWLAAQPEVRARVTDDATLGLLWDVACVPDFRKLLFESHVQVLREIFLALCEGPLTNRWLEPRIAPLGDTTGDVETLIFRISSLRTWAYVAQKAEWIADVAAWRERTMAIEDRLSDALHTALVSRFVSRIGKKRAAKKAKPAIVPAPAVANDHPFAGLRTLRDQIARREARIKEAIPADRFDALVDAPHERFLVDDRGVIRVQIEGDPDPVTLGRLAAGRTVRLPAVRVEALDFLGAGLRSRIEKRLVAFARDLVSRLLSPLAPLESADSAAVRSLAYELLTGLGVTSAAKWKLSERDREILKRHDVRVGRDVIEARALQTEAAVAIRKMLLEVYARR